MVSLGRVCSCHGAERAGEREGSLDFESGREENTGLDIKDEGFVTHFHDYFEYYSCSNFLYNYTTVALVIDMKVK